MTFLGAVYRHLALVCLVGLTAAGPALAQSTTEYEPKVGQEGKDVVWVPSPQLLVDKMMEIAKVTPQDYVIDLGSGDGRTVITAAKLGAKALGIEYNPDLVELSKRNAAKAGVGDKAKFVKADIFESDFSEATVVTMFLLPDLNLKLRPTLLNLKPGTRLVSNTFTMGEWQSDETVSVGGGNCTSWCTAHLWIVPAKVAGTWQSPQGELKLEQMFQMVTGTLKSANGTTPVNGKLAGDRIVFMAGDAQYTGKVSGDSIEGISKAGGKEVQWRATRAGK
ncbi:MAG TPA: class I SAM-dependent methyltransferase [Hyphomicrobiaceae bacterium]|nr:class I SAM-dependent methyltransferase [Hyphomicrobiaceae bacterium]